MIIISDIDGTLADSRPRYKYDGVDPHAFFAKSIEDRTNPFGVDLYESLRAERRILLSTRPERVIFPKPLDVRAITKAWLQEHFIPFDELDLRDVGVLINLARGDKLRRLGIYVNRYKGQELVYLEDDTRLCFDARAIFPDLKIFMVSYEGIERL